MIVQLDDAIQKIMTSDDPIAAYDAVAETYDQPDKDLVLPWLAEMATVMGVPTTTDLD